MLKYYTLHNPYTLLGVNADTAPSGRSRWCVKANTRTGIQNASTQSVCHDPPYQFIREYVAWKSHRIKVYATTHPFLELRINREDFEAIFHAIAKYPNLLGNSKNSPF